jgi:hypothetical protein
MDLGDGTPKRRFVAKSGDIKGKPLVNWAIEQSPLSHFHGAKGTDVLQEFRDSHRHTDC